MANNRIQVKRTSTTGRTANVTNSGNTQYIAAGELALNMTDGILYSSNGSALIEIGANNTNVNISNTLTIKSVSANGSNGTTGQLLTSNGTTTYWSSPGAASVNVAAQYTWTNTQTFTNTITFTSQVNTATLLVSTNTSTFGTAAYVVSNGNVGIATSTPGYKLEVNGSFAATTKSFIIDHPCDPNMKLRYGSLEGPENGVYIRGRSKTDVIELPEYWINLVHEDSITVSLTAIGNSVIPRVIAVANNKVYINGGISTLDYFYHIFAERKDVDKLLVEF